MFTGIIEATAKIIERMPDGITIERPVSFDDVKIGSSISVSGACLSVVELAPSSMRFDVVPETRAKTTIGGWKKGDRVNLERAMKASDRVDGHIVQGHVEATAEVISGPGPELQLLIPDALLNYVIPKGSICLDGVSLTIADIDGQNITVALIPHTLVNTTLGSLKKGDRVNVETDMLLRTA